jgi:hypothetical protein
MSTLATLVVSLTADTGKFVTEMNKAAKHSESLSSKIGKSLGTIGKFAGAAALGGIAALGAGLVWATKEAMEAQEVQAQLAAVIKSTGGAAGVTAEMANDLANSLSGVTRFEDDAIVSGENMLLTFTNIGKDVFPAATETMLDMSQALGQDLQSSAIQLGKALNDPINGVTALQRVGVTFSEEQKKMIESLVQTGDVAGAQAVILQELQKEFGGSAKAAGETFAGQLDILKNALGNAAEGVGMALLPALTSLVTGITPIINEYAPKLAAWIGEYLPIAIATLSDFWTNTLKPAILAVWNWMSTVLIPFLVNEVYPWLKDNIPKAIQVLSDFWTGVLKPAILAVWNWMSTVLIPFLQNTVVPWLQVHIPAALQALADFWNKHKDEVSATFQALWDGVMLIWERFKEALQNVVELFHLAQQGKWREFGVKLREMWDKLWAEIKQIVSNAVDKIKQVDWGQVGRSIIEGIAKGITAATHFIVEAAKKAAKAAYEAAKGFLGIESPSTLFAGLGMNMMQGMALGIQGGAHLPAFATVGASTQVTNYMYHNLTVYSNSRTEKVVDDFNMMRAMARS